MIAGVSAACFDVPMQDPSVPATGIPERRADPGGVPVGAFSSFPRSELRSPPPRGTNALGRPGAFLTANPADPEGAGHDGA